MALAIKLAKKSNPSPNPRVGAVIVKGNEILSTGYHKKAGEPHAEIVALRKLNSAKGSTLYVTLEPCSHYGKTPPCVDAIIESGVKRVVFAMRDPNPKVNGEKKLRKAGVEVDYGVLESNAASINRVFLKNMKGMPFVAVKMAMSLDGKTATKTGDSKWISGEKSREFVQKLRNEYDAVMVGIGTVLKDNPRLTCRLKKGKNPLKIIVDSKLRVPLKSKVLNGKVTIATSEGCNKKKRKELEKLGVIIIICGKNKVNLKKLMKIIYGKGITSVLIEGGSELNASAIKEKIVDKFYFFVSPKIIGGKKAKTPVDGGGISKITDSLKLKMNARKIGEDFLFEASI